MVGKAHTFQEWFMVNRIFLVLMSLILTINTSMASSHSGVKDALDEFQYVMTVEGASLDPVKANATIAEFKNRLQQFEAQGVSRQEIIETALSGIADQKTAGQMREVLAHIEAEKLSPQAAGVLINNVMAESYQRGASWNGALQALQIFGVMILMVSFMMSLLYVVTRSSDCPTNYNEEQCIQWDENVKW